MENNDKGSELVVEGQQEQPKEEETTTHSKSNGEENHTDTTTTTTTSPVNGSDGLDAGTQGTIEGSISVSSNMARMSVAGEAFRYSGSHKRRGHCVIFNHRYFDRVTGLNERSGTDRDRDQIKQLFLKLQFDVRVLDNLSVGEIKETLQDLAFGTDHTDCDMLVVIFMSHGEEDVLWGRDHHFKPEGLFENFQADKCKTLAGKPKLFFIQACRGEGLDSGVTLARTHPSDEIDSGRLAYKIPTTADFLICWSTVPGHYSWRNTTNGSWFMQSLVHVLSKEALHEDLLSMMTSVNRHMILNFESNTPCHVMGAKVDCGRRKSILSAHNNLTPPPTPNSSQCIPLGDLQCLRSYEARVKCLPQGLPLCIVRSRLDHTPTPSCLLKVTYATPGSNHNK